MLLCCDSHEEEPVDEYDPIPFSLSWRIKFGAKSFDTHSGQPIIRLGNNRLLQTHHQSTEYQALKLVDRHTSIPTFKVISVYNRPEGKLVEYEAHRGHPLDQVWSGMPAHQRARVVNDLGRFVEQLRKMEPPKHCVIGDATLGGAIDSRFGSRKIGPFYTIEAFQKFERRGHSLDRFAEQEIKSTHAPPKPYVLKFTHANLCPRNILMDGAGRICALIGWESSGWYPEYWEYTQMCHAAPKTMLDWLDAMRQVMPRYDQEFACEEALRAHYSKSVYETPISIRAPSPSPSELRREQTEIDDKNTDNTSG